MRDVNDPDVWWIAAAGREMLRTHSVPRTNLFSFTEPDFPWVMHEWLYGLIYDFGLSHFGPRFFSLFAVLSGMATLALSLAAIFRSVRSLAASALCALFVLLVLGDVFHSPRPSFASLWLPALLIAVAVRPWSLKSAAAAIGVEWLWTQLHGSFPVGIAILACAIFEGDRKKRAATTALACAATLLNPYGWKLHALVFGYGLGSNERMRWLHEHIIEFSPMWRVLGSAWFSPHAMIAFAPPIVLAASALAHRRFAARSALTLLLSAMAVVHVRHWALASLTGVLLLAPEIDAQLATFAAPFSRPKIFFGSLAPPLVLALIAFFARPSAQGGSIAPSLGGGAVAPLVSRLENGANVYADASFASVVVWEGFPRVRVFYDLRNDCYSLAMLRDFTLILDEKSGAENMLRARGTTHALVRSTNPLFVSWPEIAREGDLVLRRAP